MSGFRWILNTLRTLTILFGTRQTLPVASHPYKDLLQLPIEVKFYGAARQAGGAWVAVIES
ncbi:hypothetical protein OF846_003375 [Rhodotorula toruloides]|nr:hypothetical protein OF846_003375 [Rhodotorula toruloides]